MSVNALGDSEYFLPSCCSCRRNEALPVDHYFVYVIELGGGDSSEARTCVYVGQSWHLPECRFEQHKAGYKSSYEVRTRGIRLRRDLYEGTNPVIGRTAAENAEREIAASLMRAGFTVISA
jgi:hypothetical protein